MSLATFPLESVPVIADLSDADRSVVYPMESEIAIPAFLTSVGEQGLSLIQPIPIEIHCWESGEFLAAFREANVAMSGETLLEAVQLLSADLCDMFQTFAQEETNLGPAPARQLEILKRYITPFEDSLLTQREAEQIARKLEAEVKPKSKKHIRVLVRHEGRVIASYGIRRSRKKPLTITYPVSSIFRTSRHSNSPVARFPRMSILNSYAGGVSYSILRLSPLAKLFAAQKNAVPS